MALKPGMVTVDRADPRALAPFRARVAPGPQPVPAPPAGTDPVHLDRRCEARPAEIEPLVSLGATVLGEHPAPGFQWTVLADPEGDQFCVAG